MTPQPNSETLREFTERVVQHMMRRCVGNDQRADGMRYELEKEWLVLKESFAAARSPAEPEGHDAKKRMCYVDAEDANNYCRIVSLLGMEEEGDPVVEVGHLIAFRNRAKSEGRGVTDEATSLLREAMDSLRAVVRFRSVDDLFANAANTSNRIDAFLQRAALESILPLSAAPATMNELSGNSGQLAAPTKEKGDSEGWEQGGNLGNDEKFVRRSSPESEAAVNETMNATPKKESGNA